ncbi:16S rRNA (guanine(966)-N(2))-methyltransferase RsmD [bacterium]|nr:16S rRNA (guanine(966)-N(2))-methyltransferase RsmD [bacterium]MCI0602367.1 16S rRNA (guanine(966)-N(2))-methyltransferase RsmD [bacterium]
MRVIAGKFRSRTLKAAGHFRPTTDRVRETLFNILQNEIQDSVFVDAFAGSGSVGIEAISRGASKVIFIESNRKALLQLEQNLESCCEGESWRILTMDTWKALTLLPQQLSHVDLIFFDPPYEFSKYPQLLQEAAKSFPDATTIVEHSSRSKMEIPLELEQIKTVRIGETTLSFFRKKLQ